MPNKKYAMISQLMRDKTDEEILATRNKAVETLHNLGYEVVNTFFNQNEPDPDDVKNHPLYSLAKSLIEMSKCDTVYFCEGWEKGRGCVIEHNAAAAYGLNILDEADMARSNESHPELDRAPVDDMNI